MLLQNVVNLNNHNLFQSWTKFLQRYENFEIVTGVHQKEDTVCVTTFLSVIGQPTVDIYNTFVWTDENDAKRYGKVMDKFATFCEGKQNTTYKL